MSKRNLIVALLLLIIAGVIIWLLQPCGTSILQKVEEKISKVAPPVTPAKKTETPAGEVKVDVGQIKGTPEEKKVPPVAEEIDLAPPVTLTASEQIPNVAVCAVANFPTEAKPHVKIAVVTVRLIVDKFGKVRSVTPLEVEFPQEPAEDVLPAMRKLFIQAGSRAFGARKCPPHVVNGENVGYSIEVPLQYKH